MLCTGTDARRITVMGLGRFGGGAGATLWLARRGACVTVTDLQPASSLAAPLSEVAALVHEHRIDLRLGGHDEADFAGADLVVVNPAVPRPWDNPYLLAASAAGVPLTTEIRLLVERVRRDRVIGVTGTAGKSTTAAMIHHVLARTGHRSHLGGNIGGSLLEHLDAIGDGDWIVLELSSAMLYWLQGWSPHVAVLTNLLPNHLDWHGTLEHYHRCKLAIFSHQQPGDHALRGEAPPGDHGAALPLAVLGAHNQANARLAARAAARLGIDPADAIGALADFHGLPHRLQLVAERDGLRFYNDSKATTPQATRVAVEAFGDGRCVHLLAGGYDKKIDLSAIVELAPRLGGMYTMGATGRRLAEAAAGAGGRAEYCSTLQDAASRAVARMKRGDVLLLSPGCASWDQFENYQQRGEAFRAWVDRGC